jgi:hypothetical protein
MSSDSTDVCNANGSEQVHVPDERKIIRIDRPY